MGKGLERYIARRKLEDVVQWNPDDVGVEEARRHGESLHHLLWDIVEAVEEDKLLITEAVGQEILELVDRYYGFAVKAGGLEIQGDMSPEDARDGFKKVVEFNSRVQVVSR
ncbi:MAG: hypothetical protein WBD86_01335 [Microgenomates group bacterium]